MFLFLGYDSKINWTHGHPYTEVHVKQEIIVATEELTVNIDETNLIGLKIIGTENSEKPTSMATVAAVITGMDPILTDMW